MHGRFPRKIAPMRRPSIVGLAVVAMAPFLAAQQPAPPQGTFRANVELVTIDVVATGANGAPVHNLTSADFELLEDGVVQPIQAFQFVNFSSGATAAVLPPAGVSSNAVEPGGLFAIVIDELGLQVDDLQTVQRVATRFINETLQPNDHLAVARAAFTTGFFLASDRVQALEAVSQSFGRRERPLGLSGEGLGSQSIRGIGGDAPGDVGRDSFAVLAAAVEKLRPIPARRKAILWFSRGGDLPGNYIEALELGLPTGRDEGSFLGLIDTARAANVAVYTVSPTGLQSPAAETARDYPVLTDTLRDLAWATGGRAILNNDLDGALRRIAVENRAYYLLGYAPSPSSGKSRARKLTVRTKAAGVSLLHRKTYLPSSNASAAPLSAIESPLPLRGLQVALAPVVVAGERRRRGLIVPFEIAGALADGADVNYTVVALDPAGTAVWQTAGTLKAAGGRVAGEARLVASAKTHHVRIAASANGETLQGSAFATVKVPEGESRPPACSGFLFEQAGDRAGLRVFKRDEPLTVSTMLSAKALKGEVAFGLASPGGAVQRTWPVALGTPLAKGLWRVALNLKPSLAPGDVEIRLLVDGTLLDDSCRAGFVMR
jgi:VWFA-related protein